MIPIYEALKRAEAERKAAQPSDLPVEAEMLVSAPVEVQPSVSTEITLDDVAVTHGTSHREASRAGRTGRQRRTIPYTSFADLPDLRQRTLKSILISSGMPRKAELCCDKPGDQPCAPSEPKGPAIDGDLRRPVLHTLLGCQPKPGLAEYLAGKVALSKIMQRAASLI